MEEGQPDLRMELIDGAIYAMDRGTPWHAVMASAVMGALRSQLQRPCRAASESIAVGVAEADAT